ncbi:MAG TPA: tRNA preQ1(34) S-adenosylmethionine ribosyltransferase-isomerase QueA [Gemmatimonadales bacterium]|nr:tRNA preQ1(34) S-adenosylmethionine ribosyltransferase-isomerase QueA [Gemmatimonadales bacterium]
MTAERLRTADFDYDLPPELIAQEPLPERSASRMLMVMRADRRQGTPADRRAGERPAQQSRRRSSAAFRQPVMLPGDRRAVGDGVLVDSWFAQLTSLIPAGDLLVLNTTRVRHARLLGTRPSGAPAEVLLIHPAADDSWIALGKPGSALQPGKRIALDDDVAVETVEVLSNGNRRIRFIGASAETAITRFGRLPLPPYITRDPTAADEQRYQTVYARAEGSIAAPTAGLHFTTELLDALSAKGVVVSGLELRVGPGTFKPVESEDPRDHPMHPEGYEISPRLAGLVELVREQGGRVWAVGTTVVRALESAANPDGTVRAGAGETSLMIAPGYPFRVVDRLLTNFHLPRSTLLMLVSAFAGHELAMAAYAHAVEERYRFYSYGDAMLVL